VAQTFWKTVLWFFLGGGVLFLVSAGLLAATTHALDVYIHDRYKVILPTHLLIISAILFAATYAVWKVKFSH
jgi:hypothetical protein